MSYAMPRIAHFGTSTAAEASTEEYEFTNPQLRMNEQLWEAAGFRGTREHDSARVRQNTRAPGFSVTLHPNSVELDTWLPRILGTAESSDAFALAENLNSFTFGANFDLVTKRFYFSGCKVNTATFKAVAGGALELTLDCEALDCAASNTAFASLSISTVGPYMFSDSSSGLSVGGNTYSFAEFGLKLDNKLDLGRFLNAQTRSALPEKDREITWSWKGPYADNAATYALAAAGVGSIAAFTNGGYHLTFTSTKVGYPRELPEFNGEEELMLPLTGIARKDGSTLSLVVTNDSSP